MFGRDYDAVYELQAEIRLTMSAVGDRDAFNVILESDFSNSATLLYAEVRDADGNKIEDAVITSTAGIDYLTVIPEPGSAMLLAIAAGALGAHRPRRYS